MQALIIFALIIGVTISTGPEEVPTSLCHDPLLGPSMIIYSDCGGVRVEPEKQKKEKPEIMKKSIQQAMELVDAQPVDQVLEGMIEQPVEKLDEKQADRPAPQDNEALAAQPKEKPTEMANEQPEEHIAEFVSNLKVEKATEKPKAKKQKCNKGSGNGAEGCDPGNHPEKGNDDESGDNSPKKVEKDKTDQPKAEKQKCNKGSGNGAEGCDPGNHPENGNNDEGGESHPQNSKKEKKNK